MLGAGGLSLTLALLAPSLRSALRRRMPTREDMIFDELQKKAVEGRRCRQRPRQKSGARAVDPDLLDEDKPEIGRWYCLVCE